MFTATSTPMQTWSSYNSRPLSSRPEGSISAEQAKHLDTNESPG
jgi:hypothetical protein